MAANGLLGVGWQVKFDSETERSELFGLEPTAVELGDASCGRHAHRRTCASRPFAVFAIEKRVD